MSINLLSVAQSGQVLNATLCKGGVKAFFNGDIHPQRMDASARISAVSVAVS